MEDAVSCLITDILSGFENRKVMSAALCDISKAFDYVDQGSANFLIDGPDV